VASSEDLELFDHLLPRLRCWIPSGIFLYCSVRGCLRREVYYVPRPGALRRAAAVPELVERERRRACADAIRRGWWWHHGPVCPACRVKVKRHLRRVQSTGEASEAEPGAAADRGPTRRFRGVEVS
jgi:hypothetical protein